MAPFEEKSYAPLLSEEELDALIQGYNSRGSEESGYRGQLFTWALVLLVTITAGMWWWI
jgi:hypothetical protein